MSISSISIHNYVAEVVSLSKLHQHTLPKTSEKAIEEFREHHRIHHGAWHLGNKLDIMV